MAVERLNGMDAMLLYSETPNLHTHTMKVAVVDATDVEGPYDFDHFRRTIEERLPLLDPLRYRIVDIPGRLHHPMWLTDCPVDLDYHLRRVRVPAPGGRRELDEVIGEIASTQLDRSRPLWEFHFAEGMQGNRFALIGKVHHALADGVASANLLARLMDLAVPAAAYREEETAAPPSAAALLWSAQKDHLRQMAALPALLRDGTRGIARVRRVARERGENPDLAKSFRAPKTFLNHVVAPGRTFATASLALTDVKAASRTLGVTFTDVILSVAAGGLRELLLHYDGRAEEPIIATVPVGSDRGTERVTGNRISGLTVSLPVHVHDPLERTRLVSMSVANAKVDHASLGSEFQGRMMEYLPPTLAPAAFRRQSRRAADNKVMNVAISTVPGPRERGHIGGAPVTEIYSVGVLSAGSAFNMTVWSYVDQVDISVLSDDHTFHDVHEATAAMVRSFAALRAAAVEETPG